MGYRHIDNLYKNTTVLLFRECYALEKVHGTSAHVTLKKRVSPVGIAVNEAGEELALGQEADQAIDVTFFSGGASHMSFIQLFDVEDLKRRFRTMGPTELTVYGEAYGGSMQRMRETYGDKLLFIAFEVEIGERFLPVESADMMVQQLGLEFVPWRKISTDLAVLDAERDAPSVVAVRRGITKPMPREGIVLRPPIEIGYQQVNGGGFGRIIAKHKSAAFSERTSKKDTTVDPGKLEVLTKANEIADEWVTTMRMEHVLDKLQARMGRQLAPEDTRAVIDAMIEDVTREAKDEIVASKEAIGAISKNTAKLFRQVQVDRLKAIAPS